MKNKMMSGFAGLAFGLLVSSSAFADCSDIGNDQWNYESLQMAQAYDSGDLNGALTHAKTLTLICNRSPIINYTMSEIYRQLGDEEQSYSYARKASEFTQEYAVPQPLVEKIWLRRAENELPYKKQVEELNQVVAQKDEQIEAVKNACAEQSAGEAGEVYNAVRKKMELSKWTSAGFAIAGGAAAIAGAAVVGVYYPKANDEWSKNERMKKSSFNSHNAKVISGYTLLGIGAAAAITGSVLAIIGDLQIRNLDSQYGANQLSFSVSPVGVGVSGTF